MGDDDGTATLPSIDMHGLNLRLEEYIDYDSDDDPFKGNSGAKTDVDPYAGTPLSSKSHPDVRLNT